MSSSTAARTGSKRHPHQAASQRPHAKARGLTAPAVLPFRVGCTLAIAPRTHQIRSGSKVANVFRQPNRRRRAKGTREGQLWAFGLAQLSVAWVSRPMKTDPPRLPIFTGLETRATPATPTAWRRSSVASLGNFAHAQNDKPGRFISRETKSSGSCHHGQDYLEPASTAGSRRRLAPHGGHSRNSVARAGRAVSFQPANRS